MTAGAVLRAVRHHGNVSAAGALAWFTTGQRGAANGGPIGYLLAPGRAEWFRCEDAGPFGPNGPRDLGGAFEVFAIGGDSQLRWVHERSGAGWAVVLAEDPAALPPGDPLPPGVQDGRMPRERRRLGSVSARMLAGRVTAARGGWATLATARYSPCDVPVDAQVGHQVWAELAEYTVADEHGNLSVADTLLLGLVARGPEPAGKEHPA
jgi:hypothetical protein